MPINWTIMFTKRITAHKTKQYETSRKHAHRANVPFRDSRATQNISSNAPSTLCNRRIQIGETCWRNIPIPPSFSFLSCFTTTSGHESDENSRLRKKVQISRPVSSTCFCFVIYFYDLRSAEI